MLGNLLKESGVVQRLSRAAENEIINIATLFLGLVVGSTMQASSFLTWDTLKILISGLVGICIGYSRRYYVWETLIHTFGAQN